MSSNYGMMRGLPPIKPPVVQGDTQLPFDPTAQLQGPTDTGAPLQFSPQEQASRAALQNSQQQMLDSQRMQDVAGQSNSVLDNPLFQVGAPAILTALSAIFPRHMRTAGPIGESALNNLNYTNVMQGRTKQAQAQGMAQSATADFNKQRFQYAVSHDPKLSPDDAQALSTEADADMKQATAHYALLKQKAQAAQAGADVLSNPESLHLPPGAKAKVDMPFGSVELGGKDPSGPQDPYKDAFNALRAAHPDWSATQVIQEAKKTIASPENPDEQEWRTAHPGATGLDYIAAKSVAEGAGSRAKESADDAKLQKQMGGYLDMIDSGNFPIVSMARSPKLMGMLAEENKNRPNPVNLVQRKYEQDAVAAKLNNLQSGKTADMVNSAVTMNATLGNLEKAYDDADKAGLIPTDASPINEALLAGIAKTTGNPKATALLAAYTEAKQRADLFLQNGYASSTESAKAANNLFSVGYPASGFKSAINVTRRNANDIVTMATQTPVIGIDQNAPALSGVNIGPGAKPTQFPGMNTAPAPSPQAGLPEAKQKRIAEIQAMPISATAKRALARKEGLVK